MRNRTFYLFLVSVFLLFNSCATNPVTGKRDIILISEEQELAMGQQSDPQIVAQFGLYEDPKLQQFIQEKGQKMAAISHRPNIDYKFKIVDSPVINAFAVPGGYVYFTRGIMAYFNNEAQFAGVLGHEIGHIAARHSAQQQSKAVLAQVGMIAGMVIAPEFAQFSDAASQGVSLLFLKFGRDDERESDMLGVEYSTKIGYDATEMADFFLTLQRQQEQSGTAAVPDFLSTHPNPADRYVRVHELAAEWKLKENVTKAEINRNKYLRMIDGIIFGEDPKQGFVENKVFYHPVLEFQFQISPTWNHMNSPQQVQLAPEDGKAAMIFTLAQGETLEAAAQQMLQQYKLQPVDSKSVTVNGLQALAIVADQQQEQQQQGQQQQQAVRTLTYLIKYKDNIYSFMGITSAENFDAYYETFSNTMQSFKPLTDPVKLNKKAERIRIKTVQQPGTLAQVLKNFKVPETRMQELAILNGMELTDRVEQGMLLKTIGE